MKKKIAVINQRYGKEVNGGSEYYARMLAQRLSRFYDVTVLTTCAIDYINWDNYFAEGAEEIDGVAVRRFKTEKPRGVFLLRILNRLIFKLKIKSAWLETLWIDAQGPFCPQLVEYIKTHKHEYDAFLFVTYLYFTTVRGIAEASGKALLIPTAHDEQFIHMGIYKSVFLSPEAIVYLTEEEKTFVNEVFGNEEIPGGVFGAGVEVPETADGEAFKKKHCLTDYFIYVGRVDIEKGCTQMFAYWREYMKSTQSRVKLVIMGKAAMPVPEDDSILYLGFVGETEKYNGIAGARALILPSKFESLSLSVLESFALGVPALVNGGCAVLMGHCVKSGAGLAFIDSQSFKNGIDRLLCDNDEYDGMRSKALSYVGENYQWDVIMEKLNTIISDVISNSIDKSR